MLPMPRDPTPTRSSAASDGGPRPGWHRALPWLAGVVALAAIIASCTLMLERGRQAEQPTFTSSNVPYIPADDQVLHVAWVGTNGQQVSALDPATASDWSNLPIVQLLYDGLVTLDARLEPELWGADHVSVSADGLTYTFHLRGGQSFSDGAPVHASDYVYSLTRALDPCFQSPVSYMLTAIAGAAAFSAPANCVDGHARSPLTSIRGDDDAGTVTITLGQPAGYFLAALARPTGEVVERNAVAGASLGKDDIWTAGIVADAAHPTGQGGSGMFYVAQYDTQGNLILKRNPTWWGRVGSKKSYLTEIDYTIFLTPEDAETAINASPDSYLYDVFDPGPGGDETGSSLGDAHTVPYLAYKGVTFNWQKPPFENADARQALCLAVNRDVLAATLSGQTVTPSWHLVPQGMPGYNDKLVGIDGVTATTGDLAKARAHWAAYLATLHGAKPPTILFHYQAGSVSAQRFALALVGQWNAAFGAGTVVPNVYTSIGSIKQPPEGSYPASLFGWLADYPDPQDFLSLLYTTFSPYNSWHASVPDADRLMQQADITRDPGTRASLYHQAEQLLVQQVAACPLFQFTKSYRVQPYIHGYVEDALGEVPLDAWAGMYVGRH